MIGKLASQTFSSDFESYWVLFTYGLVPYLSKKHSK